MDYKKLIDSENLYQTVIDEETYYWKPLSLKEFNRFSLFKSQIHEYIFYNMVFEHCYVGNVHSLNNNIPAGISVSIGRVAYWVSGECLNNTFIEDVAIVREKFETKPLINRIRFVIFTVWPEYTPEDLESWTYSKLLERFTEAENILKARNPDYNLLDLNKLKNSKPVKGVNSLSQMKKDNQELAKEGFGKEHPLDSDIDQFSKKQKIAQKLDKRRR